MLDEPFEIIRAEMALRYPADHLNIAKPPRAALDIRLEVVGRVVIAVVARRLLSDLCLEEVRRSPELTRCNARMQRLELTRSGAISLRHRLTRSRSSPSAATDAASSTRARTSIS